MRVHIAEAELTDSGFSSFFSEPSRCLSSPNTIVRIERPKSIKIRAQDINGIWFEEALDGLLATVFQHEFDHLQGVLIIDHGTPKPVPIV